MPDEPTPDLETNAANLMDRIHAAVARTEHSPLTVVDPEAITRAFESDPFDLTDAQWESLVIELRRRRNAFLAQEATKSLNKKEKPKPEPPVPAVVQAKVNKPPSELSIDDLFDED